MARDAPGDMLEQPPICQRSLYINNYAVQSTNRTRLSLPKRIRSDVPFNIATDGNALGYVNQDPGYRFVEI